VNKNEIGSGEKSILPILLLLRRKISAEIPATRRFVWCKFAVVMDFSRTLLIPDHFQIALTAYPPALTCNYAGGMCITYATHMRTSFAVR